MHIFEKYKKYYMNSNIDLKRNVRIIVRRMSYFLYSKQRPVQ